jgi:hypothetical protein
VFLWMVAEWFLVNIGIMACSAVACASTFKGFAKLKKL